jgi:hypothetical protein
LTEDYWYFLLAEIDTSDDTDKTMTIWQDVRDNIRLPFFVPDPAADPNPDATHCLKVLLVA